jgi:predicted XRE-type DNA-binding protein
MKILTDKYPKGSLPSQQTDGRYIDEMYYANLKVLAEVIKDDMTFLAIVSSSTLEVGTGKSVFVQQSAEAWIHLVNTIHKENLPDLSMRNIVFKPEDLIERSFQMPKYSVIILDEWEDAHYWSKLGMSLRQFFRKCRQLNLFMFLIIPNFFQLNMTYAITRSVFFIDVRFEGKFERGYFRFYSYEKKKQLYINGKKTMNYDCIKPDFIGRFTKGYVVNEDEYRKAKAKDLTDFEKDEKAPTELEIKRNLYVQAYHILKEFGLSQEKVSQAFGIASRTGWTWLKDAKDFKQSLKVSAYEGPPHNISNINESTTACDKISEGTQPVVL